MRELQRIHPFSVPLRQFALLIATPAAPVGASGIEESCRDAARHVIGLDTFEGVADRLAGPHAISSYRCMRQEGAKRMIAGLLPPKIRAGFPDCCDPAHEFVPVEFPLLVASRYPRERSE